MPGAYQGGMHRMHVHPPPPPCIPPPAMCIPPPPQPERLVMRKDEAVGNKKKMFVYLNIIINLTTIFWQLSPGLWIRIVLMRIRIRIQLKSWCGSRSRSGGGVGQPKMCIPPGKILGTPLAYAQSNFKEEFLLSLCKNFFFCRAFETIS